jgi:hypothetical protein
VSEQHYKSAAVTKNRGKKEMAEEGQMLPGRGVKNGIAIQHYGAKQKIQRRLKNGIRYGYI